jgi:hypothetical protein
MVKIGLCVPVLVNYEGFTKLMQSVDVPVLPYVVPNWEDNIGVSGGWNQGLRNAIRDDLDYLFIMNDDIVMQPHSMTRMMRGVENNHLVTAFNTRDENYDHLDETHYIESPDYACFVVRPWEFVTRFGYFDENFAPAYFEDNDMNYRIKLAGGKDRKCTSAPMYHAGSVTQNWGGVPHVSSEMFEDNREYYRQKWGGLPGEETFKTPFNKDDKTWKDW